MPVIINIRGTSGSGKSTLVRDAISAWHPAGHTNVYEEGRKQPLGTRWMPLNAPRTIFIPGHYNTACGGCDTIKTMDQVYELVFHNWREGNNVLFEGLLLTADANRAIALGEATRALTVIRLSTPFEECLESIQQRRAQATAAGKKVKVGDPAKTKANAWSKHRGAITACERIEAAGTPVLDLSRADALAKVLELFEVTRAGRE